MQHISPNNARIAKNTLLLYLRMLFMMFINLYTSRIVLKSLGVEDYGIYNVVGGVVTLLSFINGTLSSATQRFLTFSIGKNNIEEVNSVFSTAIRIHIVIALILVFLCETLGLWFIYDKLVIPDDRLTAAIFVFQFSIANATLVTINVPYNALIISHEKMSAFAYISIYTAIGQLSIAFLINNCSFDKLIVYAFLMMLIQITVNVFYRIYCKKKFSESKCKSKIDKTILREMVVYSGWNMWGSCAVLFYTQGLNVLLNVFFGAVLNAARAISVQVGGAISQFSSNFLMAINPQITKSYAAGNKENMNKLIFRGSKFVFFLLFLIAFPIILESNMILQVWLVEIPEYTSIFIKYSLVIAFFDAISGPLMQAVASTGKIAVYQTIIGGLLLLILPISYLLLKLGGNPTTVYIVHLCIAFLSYIFRVLYISVRLGMSFYNYFKLVVLRILLVSILSVPIPIILHIIINESILNSLIIIFISFVIIISNIFFVGLDRNEKDFLINKISSYIYVKKN